MSQLERYEQGGIGRWYWDFRDRAIMDLSPTGKILDVGCGEMITTRKIGAIGMDVDNGDVRGSVYALPFKDESFDTVLFSEVIEHLNRPRAAIVEIRRVLKTGGRIIMLFPNDRTFKLAWFLCGMWGEITRDRGHLYQWEPLKAWAILYLNYFRVTFQRSIPFKYWPFSLHHIIVGEKC
jgi:SAM-dependent methyltransferase